MNSSDSKKNICSDLFESLHDENVVENYEEKKNVSVSQIFLEAFYLGSTSIGSYQKKNNKIKKIVNEKRHITLKSFNTLVCFAEHLPGPTATQIIVAISAVKTNSIIGTLFGFIGYILPGLSLSLFLSSFVYFLGINMGLNATNTVGYPLITISSKNYFQYYLQIILTGLNQGSLAILLLNGIDFSNKFSNSIFHLFLIFFSAITYYFFNSFPFMILIMIICGLLSLMKCDQDYVIGIEDFTMNLSDTPFIGTQCLIVYLLAYIMILISVLYLDLLSINFYLMQRFFMMGSIVIGGGASVVPFIMSEFSLENLITEQEVLSGFSIVTLLPGPTFNIACIIATMINGPIAGLLSTIVLFLPGILFILWGLPYIKYFKQMYSLQRFLSGVTCAGTGFIFTACFKLWIITCMYNPFSNWIVGSLNFILSCILISTIHIIEPIAIIISSIFLLCVKIIIKV